MMRPVLAVAAALLVAATATGCGDDDAEVTTDTTITDEATTTTSGAPADGELPGERIEIFPSEGAELAVVGVAADDTLRVRSGPGTDFDVVTELGPLASGIVATGHNRQLDGGGIWAEVDADGETGWANVSFLSHLGATDDATAELYPSPADRPSAETMLELGQLVAEEVASDEPPSDIVVVDGPSVGDLGEVTVDVVGLGDDSVGGYRLHVFGQPDEGGESFTVRTVERTVLCTRGVTSEGLCV